MSGWVKLHRGLLNWEWYDDANTARLFIHCLLRANHADKTWRGKLIKRGSFFTSLDTLAAETGLSVRMVRTSLDRLISTNELTSSGQARGRMITIVKYDLYQGDDKLDDKEATGSRQARDKLPTTNKNDKNEKNLINTIFSESGMSDEQISEIIRVRKKNKGGAISERVAKSLVKEFIQATKIGWQLDDSITEWESRRWKSFKSEWLKPKINGVSQYETTGRTTTPRPDNSAAGRVRQNAAEARAKIEREIAEIGGDRETVGANGLDVWP